MKIQLPFSIILSAVLLIGISQRVGGRVQYQSQDIPSNCGVVEGRVVDATGKPVSGVRVYSMINDRPPRGRLLSTITDDEGRFSLKCVELGRNSIYVSKENKGYPDTALTPFLDDRVPVVDVVEQQVIEGVEVHLPPKSGKLSGRIIDAQTHRPVIEAKLDLCRVDAPNKCYTTRASLDGEFSLLMPPIAFTLKASAPGYEDWYYTKSSSSANNGVSRTVEPASLQIRPTGGKDMSILLRPLKQ